MTDQQVPLFNLAAQHESLKEEINAAAVKALNSTHWLLGPETENFEKEFAAMTGAKYAVACSSGASAIQIALIAAGIGKGDEVITTPFTFVATTTSVSLTGADFVFADIDPATYNIDAEDIRRKITKKTKAILPVHLYGYPANMPEIMKIAKEHNLKVIEDCAQSHLAMCGGVMTGAIGDAGAFSFYPSKNLGACGDAGAITANDAEIAETCRCVRHSGRAKDKAYEYDYNGSTLRMDEVQAAILRVKMKHLGKWTEERRRVAALYAKHFKGTPVTLPPNAPEKWSQSFYVYTIRAPKRDQLMEHLKKKNIGCAVYYPVPLYKQPVYKNMNFKAEDFPNAELAAKEVVSVPIFPEMTEAQVETVCKAVGSFYD